VTNPKDTNIIKIIDDYENTIARAVKEFRKWPRWKVENTATAFSGRENDDLIRLWEKLQ